MSFCGRLIGPTPLLYRRQRVRSRVQGSVFDRLFSKASISHFSRLTDRRPWRSLNVMDRSSLHPARWAGECVPLTAAREWIMSGAGCAWLRCSGYRVPEIKERRTIDASNLDCHAINGMPDLHAWRTAATGACCPKAGLGIALRNALGHQVLAGGSVGPRTNSCLHSYGPPIRVAANAARLWRVPVVFAIALSGLISTWPGTSPNFAAGAADVFRPARSPRHTRARRQFPQIV